MNGEHGPMSRFASRRDRLTLDRVLSAGNLTARNESALQSDDRFATVRSVSRVTATAGVVDHTGHPLGLATTPGAARSLSDVDIKKLSRAKGRI